MVIHEAPRRWNVIYYLGIVLKNGQEVVVAFEVSRILIAVADLTGCTTKVRGVDTSISCSAGHAVRVVEYMDVSIR